MKNIKEGYHVPMVVNEWGDIEIDESEISSFKELSK